jgi:hypothetical protein
VLSEQTAGTRTPRALFSGKRATTKRQRGKKPPPFIFAYEWTCTRDPTWPTRKLLLDMNFLTQ